MYPCAKEDKQMSETKIIRIIHILMGILLFVISVVAVFCLAYFGVSKMHASNKDQQTITQENDQDDQETDSSEDQPEEISSVGKSISIYNGSRINGLAGRWKEKLTEDGYYIERVDNYSETLDNGIILVKEEGMGLDLQREYFPDAEIQVGTPEDDVDIQIILGKSEDDSE